MSDQKPIDNQRFAIEPVQAVDFHLRSSWLDVYRMYNGIAQQHGITMSMAFILINISKKGSNPTKIGPKMGMQANSLSRSLKTLEEKGLIYRQKATGDKRAVEIFLTPEGVAARRVANSIIADYNEKLYARITPEMFDTFVEVIRLVHESASEMRKQFNINEETVDDI